MGDWQNIISMNGAYSPWDLPGWNDNEDRRAELYDEGYRSAEEWTAAGRIIKTGSKGFFVPCVGRFFKEEDLEPIDSVGCDPETNVVTHFETFQEAQSWAKRNPGKAISRSPQGDGFIYKSSQ